MKTYTYTPKAGSFSFCKQESIVFQALKDLESATIEELAARCEELGLKTRQTAERIVAYYMVSLKKHGLVSITGQTTGTRRVTIVIGEEPESEDDFDEPTEENTAPDRIESIV
jgi:hypothetical protein